jgi:hypothetical protein
MALGNPRTLRLRRRPRPGTRILFRRLYCRYVVCMYCNCSCTSHQSQRQMGSSSHSRCGRCCASACLTRLSAQPSVVD